MFISFTLFARIHLAIQSQLLKKWILFKCMSVLIFLKNAAEVEVHPNGKWMYFSNRIGSGAIIAFEVQEDGNLNFLQVR